MKINKDKILPLIEFTITPLEEFETPEYMEEELGFYEGFAKNVRKNIDNYGLWGWCTVNVKATLLGFEGDSYLGCCSYKDEEDFKKGGYLPQMKDEAFDELIGYFDEELLETIKKIANAIE